MMVIHVIRKPLSEGNVASNVLQWGTGGLNIEVSRIASHSGSTSQQPSGRWPANLILEHKAGCQHVGEVTVQGNKLASRGLGGQNGSYSPIGTEGGHDFADEDGNETIPQWECSPGCPVVDLDRQTGVLHARGNKGQSTTSSSSYSGGWAGAQTLHHMRPELSVVGGASRYFKQVRG